MRIRLCGTVEAGDGERVAGEDRLGGRQARLVLALLLVAPSQPCPRDALADALWPGGPPPTWEPALRGIVTRVRRFLAAAGVDPTVLVSTAGGYAMRLPAGVAIDVVDAPARSAEAAAALAHGDVATAARLADAAAALARPPLLPDEDHPWLCRARDDLRRALGSALLVRSEAAERRTDHGLAVASAEEAVALAPFDEQGHVRLVRAHAAAGNRASARLAFHRCRELLLDEVGVEPSAATTAACQEAIGASPGGARPSAGGPARTGATDVRPRWLAVPHGEIVGRGPELDRLWRSWRQVGSGGPALVLVEGEPGIGKTRLVAELADAVLDDAGLVLAGACEQDGAGAYQPFREALDRYVRTLRRGERAGALGPLAGELVHLVPGLPELVPGLPRPARVDGEAARHRLFDAVAGALSTASSVTPVLVVIDDLHWAALPAVLLLRHILQAPDPLRVLVVATVRDTDVDDADPVARLLDDSHRLPSTERVALRGLDEAAVAEMLAGTTAGDPGEPAPGLAAAVRAQTSGNPFLVDQLRREARDAGGMRRRPDGSWDLLPGAVTDGARSLLRQRLERVGPAVRTVLEAAAVIGPVFPARLLASVAGQDADDVLTRLDAAERARLVEARSGSPLRYAFSHALLRAALVDDLPTGRRLQLHRATAVALERPGSDAPAGGRLTALAHHHLAAAPLGGGTTAAVAAKRAADEAMEHLAFEDAAEWYGRGLSAVDGIAAPDPLVRCDLEVGLARARHALGAVRQRELLLAAGRRALAIGDRARAADAALGFDPLGHFTQFVAMDEDVVGLMEAAMAGLGADQAGTRARLMAALGLELYWTPRHPRARALGDEAVDLARAVGDPELVTDVLVRQRLFASGPDDLSERFAVADELIVLGDGLDRPGASMRGRFVRFEVLLERGEVAAAEAELAMAGRLADDAGSQVFRLDVAWARAALDLFRGDLDAAAPVAETAVEAACAAAVVMGGALLYTLRMEQGRLGELRGVLASLAVDQPGMPAWPAALAHLHLCEGDLREAARCLAGVADRGLESVPRTCSWIVTMMHLADVAAAVGDRDACVLLARLLGPYAGRNSWNGAVSFGPVDRSLGGLARALGDDAAAARHLSAAADQCRTWGAAPWLSRTLAALDRM